MERVAADVAFFTTRPVAEVLLLVFLPVTLFETHVPKIVASVPVMAVIMAFITFDSMPGFSLPFAFSSSAAAFSASFWAVSCSIAFWADVAPLDDV